MNDSPFPSGVEGQLDTLNLALDNRIAEADIRAHRTMKVDGVSQVSFAIFQHVQELVDLQRDLYENPYEILWMPEEI